MDNRHYNVVIETFFRRLKLSESISSLKQSMFTLALNMQTCFIEHFIELM